MAKFFLSGEKIKCVGDSTRQGFEAMNRALKARAETGGWGQR
jgi:hypothetical protein